MAKRKRDSLSDRYEHSYKTKDFDNIISEIMQWSKFDGEIKFYKPKEGKNKIDIIPYIIKTKNHPLVARGKAEIGEEAYNFDVYVHRGVGPVKKDIVCLKNNYGKPCPICEMADEANENGDSEEYNALKAKRRVYYNVLNAKEPDEGVMVFSNISHFLFEKELIEEAKDCTSSGESYVNFAHIKEGYTIGFRGNPEKYKNKNYLKFKNFSFLDRDEELDESLIDEAISFDELVEVLDYKQIQAIIYGQEIDEEEEKPKRKKKVVCEEDEIDEEEKPKRKKKVEEDEDEENNEKECPYGHRYGKDTDSNDDCTKCESEVWNECTKIQTEYRRKNRKKRK